MQSYLVKREIPIRLPSPNQATHANIVDVSIKRLTCYRLSKRKVIITSLFSLLLFFIPLLISLFSSRASLILLYIGTTVHNASHVFVETENDNTLVQIEKMNFSTKSTFLISQEIPFLSAQTIQNSRYLSTSDKQKEGERLTFYYQNKRFLLDEVNHEFKPIFFDFTNFTFSEVIDYFSRGIQSIAEYNYLLNKFGENKLTDNKGNFLLICLKKFIHPYYIFALFAFSAWVLEGYLFFVFFNLFLMLIFFSFNFYSWYLNYKSIFNIENSFEIEVKRNFNVI